MAQMDGVAMVQRLFYPLVGAYFVFFAYLKGASKP